MNSRWSEYFDVIDAAEHVEQITRQVFGNVTIIHQRDHENWMDRYLEVQVTANGGVAAVLAPQNQWQDRIDFLPSRFRGLFRLAIEM